MATALAVDTAGNVYVTGATQLSNFPLIDAFQNILGTSGVGNCGASNFVSVPDVVCPDAFVVKFGPSGDSRLLLVFRWKRDGFRTGHRR